MAQLKKYPFLSVSPGVNWQKVDKTLLANLNALGRSRGQIITLESGYRDAKKQYGLYQDFLSGRRAGPVAPAYYDPKTGEYTSTSKHSRGEAVDAYINGVPIGKATPPSALAKFGLRARTDIDDPSHTELASKASGAGVAQPAAPAAAAPAGNDGGAAPADTPIVPPSVGTPPAAQDPNVEMPGTAQHYLPGSDPISQSWQQIAQLPDLSPDTERLIALSSGG